MAIVRPEEQRIVLRNFLEDKVQPVGGTGKSAVLFMPKVKVRMENQHSFPPSEASWLVPGTLYHLCLLWHKPQHDLSSIRTSTVR
jgi:hypothetical protein